MPEETVGPQCPDGVIFGDFWPQNNTKTPQFCKWLYSYVVWQEFQYKPLTNVDCVKFGRSEETVGPPAPWSGHILGFITPKLR